MAECEIYIDGCRVDIDERTAVSVTLSITDLTSFNTGRTGYTRTIILPMTPFNTGIMADCDQLNSWSLFNNELHKAKVVVGGFTILEGVPRLLKAVKEGDGGYFMISVLGAERDWVDRTRLKNIGSVETNFREYLTDDNILKSWSWDKPVKFFPVARSGYLDGTGSGLIPTIKILSFEDYHPFIHIRSLIQQIFGECGYNVMSDFLSSDLFDSLYMSGNYTTINSGQSGEVMNFLAGRVEAVTAKADSYGLVYADPTLSASTIGNVVTVAAPVAGYDHTSKFFNSNDCFRELSGRICFLPENPVKVGFEYDLTYISDYYIAARDEIEYFDTVYFDDGQQRNISNIFTDHRGTVVAGKEYTIIVFNYTGQTFLVAYDDITNPDADPDNPGSSDFVTRSHGLFTARSHKISINCLNPIRNLKIMYQQGSRYVLYQQDWALYDGYVEETGSIKIHARVRTTPETVTPSNPKYFDGIYFKGKPGRSITLCEETTLKPVYTSYPTLGSQVSFEDICSHKITRLEFLNAVKHMFNFIFYTDPVGKNVYIEPRDSFYLDDVVIDWSEKVDLTRPVTVTEPGTEVYKNMVFGYNNEDEATRKWNNSNRDRLGEWSTTIDSAIAIDGTKSYTNHFYNASVSSGGLYSEAPSAKLVKAGDATGDDLNFPAKVVISAGITPLPAGERWGWPGYTNHYPRIYFHAGGNDTTNLSESNTLCFEDRDGQQGLHRFYDKQIHECNRAKRIEIYLWLEPADIEPFVLPNSLRQDFRALYRLRIDGEYGYFRIESIIDYNPDMSTPARCIFIQVF